jgi:hypothetical protein
MPLVFGRKRFCLTVEFLEGFIVAVNRMWWSVCILTYHQLKREPIASLADECKMHRRWCRCDSSRVACFSQSDVSYSILEFLFEFHKNAFCHACKHSILCGFCTQKFDPNTTIGGGSQDLTFSGRSSLWIHASTTRAVMFNVESVLLHILQGLISSQC